MTTEGTYSDSAISDRFVSFFNSFKENNDYKYVHLIENILGIDLPIELDYNDFTNEIKEIIEKYDVKVIHRSVYRSIKRVLQTRIGSAVDGLIHENRIKFTIANHDKFGERIFDDNFDLLEDEHEYEMYQKSIPNDDVIRAITWMVGYYIKNRKMLSKLDIIRELIEWLNKLGKMSKIGKKMMELLIDDVFSNPDTHKIVLSIAFDMGSKSQVLLLHKSQIQEAGEYIKAKYHMKRFGDLVGDVKFYNGVYYEGNAESKILVDALQLLFQSTNAQRNEVVKYIESSLEIIDLDSLDEFVNMIPCQNGIYDVKTGNYREGFNHNIITFDQMPFNYDVTAKRGKIKEIIEFILQSDRSRNNFFDWCSCAFLTYTGLTFLKILESKAGMGKTTLGNYIRMMVGRKNVGEPKFHVLVRDATTRIDMHRKRVIIDSDMSEKTPNELPTFKKWAFQEWDTDRSIYGHNIDYRPTPIMLGMANRLFEIPDEVELEAMADRTDIDKLTRRIRGKDDEVIKDVKNVIVKAFEDNPKECDAELTFLLHNATRIYRDGEVKSRQPTDIVMQLWNRLGNLVRQFTQVRIKKIENGWISNERAWITWQDYAILKNIDVGERNIFLEKFRKIMNLDKPTHRRITGTDKFEYGYNGVRLLTDEEIEKIEQRELSEYDR